MDLQSIDPGAVPNDRTGTPLRDAATIINDNFAAVGTAVDQAVALAAAAEQSATESQSSALASAASAAQDAATSATGAQISTEQAGISTTQSSIASAASSAALISQQGAQTAAAIQNTLSAAPTALPYEVTAITGGGGTGGTPGTYIGATTGGPAGFQWSVVVGSTGAAVCRIDNPGLSTSNSAPTLTMPTIAGLTGATTPVATVGVIPANRMFYAPSADGTLMQAWGNNAGVLATAPFGGTQISLPLKPMIDALSASFATLSASFAAIFSQVDQSVIGSTIYRFTDVAGHLILSLDQDATVGFTCNVPFNVPAGTIPLTALVNSPLVLTANEGNGYAFRWMTSDGSRMFGGIPLNYPGRPADLNVLRARYADAFPGAVDSMGTWFLGGTIDPSTGNQTLWTRNVLTGDLVQITSTGHAMAPRIDGNRAVWIDGTKEHPMWRPLDGSDIARRVLPGSAIAVCGDSLGQCMENGLTGAIGGGMTTVSGQLRRCYGTSQGSQRIQAIATRFGVPNLAHITFPSGSIAASGATACNVDYDFLVGASGNAASYGVAISVPGPSGPIPGALARTWNSSTSTPIWAFTPLPALGAAATVGTATMPLTVLNDMIGAVTDPATIMAQPPIERLRDCTVIIRDLRNDIDKPDFNQATCIAQIQAMIARVTTLYKQVVVCGVITPYAFVPTGAGSNHDGTNTGTDAQCTAGFEADLASNAALKAAFGTAYFDAMANHKAAGLTGTWTSTTTGKTYDYLTSVASSDGVHENATGWNNTGVGMQNFLAAKGF